MEQKSGMGNEKSEQITCISHKVFNACTVHLYIVFITTN